ncbi:hypothetical protein F5Y14DRAFT_459109 [Nemania sp. NC0429]|nr:hypothetical protein F5Y14DRAFT_459109 [Nemania sp. NC0429]
MSIEEEEIKPAKGVLLGAPNFLREQLPRCGKKVRGELDAIIRYNQPKAKPSLQSEDNLISSLTSIPLDKLIVYVNSEMKKTREADAALSMKRTRGIHKRAAQLQDFAVAFSQFLGAYSGIVDIVQTADSQYGNVAFATLSLLFATLKAKADAEESIQACMLHISDRMPDLEIYKRIYPNRGLARMLAEAYGDIILFAREVTIYLQARGFARYMRHLGGSPEFQVRDKRMRENLNRISTKCELLLAKKIDDLTKENQNLHSRQDEILMRGLVKTLGLHDYPTKGVRTEQLIGDRTSLRQQFGSDRRREKMDAQHFLHTDDGKYWDGPGSMLLLLCGRNEKSSSSPDCWLSLAATELAGEYLQSDISVAYERCSKTSTLEITLSHLIFQFLENNPAVIRQPEDFREIDTQISRNGGREERIEALRLALLRIINVHNVRVHIILNRPELCEASEEESCTEYITTMLSLVKEVTTELKIMMVLKSELWDFEKNRKGVDTHSRFFQRVQLDQGLTRT